MPVINILPKTRITLLSNDVPASKSITMDIASNILSPTPVSSFC